MAAELDMGSCWIYWMIASYSSPNLIGGSREGNFPKIQDSEVQNPSDFDCTLKITLWEGRWETPKEGGAKVVEVQPRGHHPFSGAEVALIIGPLSFLALGQVTPNSPVTPPMSPVPSPTVVQ